MSEEKEIKKDNQNFKMFIICLGAILFIILIILVYMDRQDQRRLDRFKFETNAQIVDDMPANPGDAARNQGGGIF